MHILARQRRRRSVSKIGSVPLRVQLLLLLWLWLGLACRLEGLCATCTCECFRTPVARSVQRSVQRSVRRSLPANVWDRTNVHVHFSRAASDDDGDNTPKPEQINPLVDNSPESSLHQTASNEASSSVAGSSVASFGDKVSLRKPNDTSSANTAEATASFGDFLAVPLAQTARLDDDDDKTKAAAIRKKNIATAVLSILLAVSNWLWQYTHPIQPVQLLVQMQNQSPPLSVIGNDGKPAVVDFWAPWCDNCKLAAPTLKRLERTYGDRINFVMVNGDLSTSWPAIEALGVDTIPHLALVRADGTVATALIGPVPQSVLTADLDALLLDDDDVVLPYQMLDVFAGKSAQEHKVRFPES